MVDKKLVSNQTDPKMVSVNKKLTKITIEIELSKGLEKHLTYLETVSKRGRGFIIKEALVQYLEDAEDTVKVLEWEKKKNKKYYTSEELDKLLEKKGLKETKL
ncbi:MAG: hypothetical protein I3273_06915 [Candidatus Moeniiplasma glomeromycotorum]|nr:hypothetical protein [Candidatus Moeniiplasma glomeromycotorum]MCE8168275.1 hypothetical protein [Candidatus Moeniiplasma glomeromycotorum]MCE8169817.1 hypothetical protein [Candidatus Moeniiplasma glomeromycotorum]